VSSPVIADAALPNVTVVTAHKSSIVGVLLIEKVLPVNAVHVIEKGVVILPPVGIVKVSAPEVLSV